MKLGVNIDHIATVRQARGTFYPDPVAGALLAEKAGCDSIVAHLREDRRHIQEADIFRIKEAITIPFNLEMSVNKDIVSFARKVLPYQATLVPERRQELTTEGGIDVLRHYKKIYAAIKKLKGKGIKVSLFIDPLRQQIKAAREMGAEIVEFNTGKFSESKTSVQASRQIDKLAAAVSCAQGEGFSVSAGHGIDYENVKKIIGIQGIEELNIGHSIIARALFVGMSAAVGEMVKAIKK